MSREVACKLVHAFTGKPKRTVGELALIVGVSESNIREWLDVMQAHQLVYREGKREHAYGKRGNQSDIWHWSGPYASSKSRGRRRSNRRNSV